MPVFRRKERIVVKFQIAGVIYRRTVPEATSIAQGKMVEAQMKLEIFEGRYGAGKDALFSDFVERQFTPYYVGNFKASVSEKIAMFCKAFKGKYLKDISQLTIERWKIQRAATNTHRGHPPHPATIQNDLALLSSIFELACDNDFLTKNPMRTVKRYSAAQVTCRRERLLEPDEEKRLWGALEKRGGEVLWCPLIARHTGMRLREVLRLKREDVDFNAWTIAVKQTKNDRPRTLPVVDILKPIFLAMPVYREGYLFSRRTGRSFQTSRSAWGKACQEAEIQDFRYHDLRHLFASSLPPDPYLRAAWLGHTTIKTSHIYSHVTLEKMRQGAEVAKVLNFERTSQRRDKQEQRSRIAK